VVTGDFYNQKNPFQNHIMFRSGVKRRATIAAAVLLACCRCASALNPSLDINQFAHNSWTIRDGFFKSVIYSIAQTPDGYLWLGTEFGLLRFDGVRSVTWQPPSGEHLPSTYIRSVLAGRDGRLWIGTTEGLVSWKDGKLTHYAELAGQNVHALLEDREGVIWAGGSLPTGKLCAIRRGSAQCYGQDGSLGRGFFFLHEDSGGSLWAAGPVGLLRWKPDPPKLYPMPDTPLELESDNGALLISTRNGIRRLVDGKVDAYQLPDLVGKYTAVRLLRDRDGGLWIGTTDRGLVHVHQGRTDVFRRSDGLSDDYIQRLFEDREGNIWVSTVDGLDRFRDFAIPTISVKQGLSDVSVVSVLAARDGSIWFGTRDGLNRWNDGKITIYRKRGSGLPDDNVDSLAQDIHGRIWVSTHRGVAYLENGRFISVAAVPAGVVESMAGDTVGSLWIGDQKQGLFHLMGASVVDRIPWPRMGRKDFASALLSDPLQGGLWLGFYRGGVAYFKDGQVRASYANADGLGEGRVTGLELDGAGTLWAATAGGLSRVKNGRVATLTSRNGLPCDTVHWAAEDDSQSFWLYTACGLVRIARSELDAWAADPKRMIQSTTFDISDGVRLRAIAVSEYTPRVAKASDGKLWFLPFDGVNVIDPRHIPFNKVPPPVHIEQIIADDKTYDTSSGRTLRLPPLSRHLEIAYTALSLVAPEKILFRFKLEGWDRDWRNVGNRRQAYYTNLSPGNYRFRVAASNNSGVWNEAGASFDFSIAPAYYQTRWFQVSCVGAFLGLLWALYQYRLHQIAQEFNFRLEERVGERTRIARELHDTLLQSFHGLLFRFQAARNMLPRRPEEAMQLLDTAITRAEEAVAEGRGAIQDLRPAPFTTRDLAHLLTAAGQELAAAEDGTGHSPAFRVTEEGERQTLSPILQDEVYRIARELLRNAFRHAGAHRIEAEIRYDNDRFRLRIRDDGKGIAPKVLQEGGRAGHWGLPGMRERSKQIGASLDFWSETGAGTEVELSVPASVAYANARDIHGFRLFRRKTGTHGR
jgi:signal transduction histidine kinase/ligand-binding sensor domain-containing protein